jgi:hypothetical protein
MCSSPKKLLKKAVGALTGGSKSAASFLTNLADPANVSGARSGGFDLTGAIDPGGTLVKAATGSDIAQKIADPFYALTDANIQQRAEGVADMFSGTPPENVAAQDGGSGGGSSAFAARKRLKGGRGATLLTGESGLTKQVTGSPSTLLGG